MKKDRNAFFNEANFSQSSYMGTPNMPMNGNFGGPMPTYGSSQASQSFYAGPTPNFNQTNVNDYTSDIESRLSKIERQLNRMDARISKLESKDFTTDTTLNNNMYML